MISVRRRLAAALSEMWFAQRRMYALRTALDGYLADPHLPPDTYTEFLARTSGFLLHEPPAGSRLGGRRVG
jgi:hypothetical protein